MAETFASKHGLFVIDDTIFPKQGTMSVGVQRQYCGASGKKANCQVAPSVHDVSPKGHYPLAMRLSLPESWLADPKRLDRADVPQEERRAQMRKGTWRKGTKGTLSGRFAWLRVWPGSGWATDECFRAEPVWLLIEEQADGKIKYALSNLPEATRRIEAVRLWKSRWPVEQGYQQM